MLRCEINLISLLIIFFISHLHIGEEVSFPSRVQDFSVLVDYFSGVIVQESKNSQESHQIDF